MEVRPNFLIAGTDTAGTTSLYHYLKSHPKVFMSKIKESHYFILHYNTDSTIQIRNKQDYLNFRCLDKELDF